MSKKSKFKKIKITKKAVVTVVLLALAGVAGWLLPIFIINYQNSAEQAKQKEAESKRLEAQDLRVQGRSDEAISKLDAALNDKDVTDSQRYELYLERGSVPFDKGDYLGAIGFFEKAEQIRQDYKVVRLLGLAWESAGNNEKAVEYYKKSIPLVVDSPLRDETIEDLQKAIVRLGGTP